jgi:uncharacterized membrane protein HdeD (DUF308 family)
MDRSKEYKWYCLYLLVIILINLLLLINFTSQLFLSPVTLIFAVIGIVIFWNISFHHKQNRKVNNKKISIPTVLYLAFQFLSAFAVVSSVLLLPVWLFIQLLAHSMPEHWV